MKIELAYPKIPEQTDCPLKDCIAFEKYDGTNIHIDFDILIDTNDEPLCCFNSFGTRRDSFYTAKDFISAHPELKEVPELIAELQYDHDLGNYLIEFSKHQKCNIKIFAEFFGQNSFAGEHIASDPKQLVIFDIMLDGSLIYPDVFIKDFSQFNIAKVVYKGKYNGQFINDVYEGKYQINEGVVCKGIVNGQVYMTKIKTNAYLKKL